MTGNTNERQPVTNQVIPEGAVEAAKGAVGVNAASEFHAYRSVRWGGELRSKWDGSVDESSGWRTSCLCGWESNPCESIAGSDDEFRDHSGQSLPRRRISI